MGQFQFWSYSRVETSGGIRASLAGRYASALLDLARDERQIDSVSRSLEALSQREDPEVQGPRPLLEWFDAAAGADRDGSGGD